MDQDKVCNGFTDCPEGEDEKKCTALIEDDTILHYEKDITLAGNMNNSDATVTKGVYLSPKNVPEMQSSSNKDAIFDQEAVESSILESTTLSLFKDNSETEKMINSESELAIKQGTHFDNHEHLNGTTYVSGREISSNAKDVLTHGNSIHVNTKKNGSTDTINFKKEINNYNEKGYINIRKNGKWGKLCLSGMDGLLQERQASWSIEDLGRAVCKAITYQ